MAKVLSKKIKKYINKKINKHEKWVSKTTPAL